MRKIFIISLLCAICATSSVLFAQLHVFSNRNISICLPSSVTTKSRLTFQNAENQYIRSYSYGGYITMIRSTSNIPYPANGSWGRGTKVNADASFTMGELQI